MTVCVSEKPYGNLPEKLGHYFSNKKRKLKVQIVTPAIPLNDANLAQHRDRKPFLHL